MLYRARRERIPLIDASEVVTAVHQNHDYSHLPGNQPHYRLPESETNVRLAGGRAAIFTLDDADWRLTPTAIVRQRLSPAGLGRSLEAYAYAALPNQGWLKFAWPIFHPIDGLRYLLSRGRRRGPGISGARDEHPIEERSL